MFWYCAIPIIFLICFLIIKAIPATRNAASLRNLVTFEKQVFEEYPGKDKEHCGEHSL
jgi:hypothetical protein